MNKNIMEGKWKQLAGKVKETWGDLTDDDILRIKGDTQQLRGLLQEKYGRSQEEAEREIKDFIDRNP